MTLSSNPQRRLIDQFDRAVVVGLGATGFSVVRYLRSKGLAVSVVDSRSKPPIATQLFKDFPEVNSSFGSFASPEAQKIIDCADLLIVSPGVALSTPELLEAKKRGAILVGDIELFIQENEADLIAITGSNGKSTVTTLVGEMAAAAGKKPLVAGNIGLPVLDAITDDVEYDLAVLELSSFQLETTNTIGARTATILNISADHMDRYASFGDYVLAKARVLKGSKIAVLPSHFSGVSQITTSNDIVRFSLQEPQAECDFGLHRTQGKRWLLSGSRKIMQLRDVPLVGTHNISNVLAAFALLADFKLDIAPMVRAVKNFKGLSHRMQTVAQTNGVVWVNDSKATNIGATASALKSLEQPIIWIAGGEGKGADFNELAELDSTQIKHLITLGRDGDQIAKVFAKRLPINSVKTLNEAVLLAAELAVKGDLVLLSPACASFDMFANYVERGEQFVECVTALTSAKLRKGA